jgi:hypothetical protein
MTMTRHAIILAVPALLLSGCNKGVEMKNASTSDVAKQVEAATADGQFVSPGRWESTMTMVDMTMPGMPPEASAQMKGMMGKPKTFTSCLSEAEAKKPKEDFFAGGDGGDCRYDHFTLSGGKIDAAMICKNSGATRTMTMKGTYSPDRYHMAMAASGTGGPGGGMSMKMELDAKRTGACTGKEAG